ncbi:MAG: pyruvate carboxylase [Oscillospiraceae bacterium]|nr:pyruvate carboxylase [Oscillospiraceae bacterium]
MSNSNPKQIKKVLVANRGEIAIRIFRACHDMHIGTVAIYSKEDKYTLFRTKADEAYQLNENKSPLGAYLDIRGIIKLAKKKGADAIHPGYGFLSENADFAKACEDAGIIFIGPPSHVLANMGDKIAAKKVAMEAGVPVIQGTANPLTDVAEAKKYADEFGYPVILKAAAGGGGKGMRLISKPEEMDSAFDLVRSEAHKSFGSEDVFLEKYLEEPKHIEVQIMADSHGNIVHLYERDCSVQRRYQKVVEFAPAFTVSDDKRSEIHADAVKIAKAVGYVNAGTVEFLVDKHGNHYFIEMNPRVQVEHTVTEMITGVDIVQTQIAVAEGYRLSDPQIGIASQKDVHLFGYSIQSRVTTEDPANNFAPDTGKIEAYRSGGGFGVRLDAGNAFTGAVITPFYDSLLVKIITVDRTFDGAIRKMLRSLREIRIRGVKTNIAFLSNVLTNDTFRNGNCHTKFIDEHPSLFEFRSSRDRAGKLLSYIGKTIIENPDYENKPIFAEPKLPQGYSSSNAPKVADDSPKQILDRDGAEALSKWILSQKKLLITDTTTRDAQQSLIATPMRTRDIVAAATATASILKDCFSLEMWGGATFDTSYRFLSESPWERLDVLRERIPNIPFQMLFRGANAVGYSSYPDNLIKAFIKEAAAGGIDIFRVFDSLNWLPNMEYAIEEILKTGKVANVTMCYTGDILDDKRDKYNLKYYIDLAGEIQKRGAHILTIKDMSGLLKPYAAKKLVSALKDSIDIPIHLHTHDTSGNQVAACMMACEAGVDIVDTAISSMSSLTSQPSMNSLCAALAGSERDPGFNQSELQKLTDYWADVRPFYKAFEGDIITPETEIYRLEIPGGQYTNLKSQVSGLGLGDRFDEVKQKYVEANDILGDIVKVTPSSKMVGDLAIFMTQNDLTPENIVERGKTLAFPESVIGYFKGFMGQPTFGFPEDLKKSVLKTDKAEQTSEQTDLRPGRAMPPVDLDKVKRDLEAKFGVEHPEITGLAGGGVPSDRDAVSWCLYPKVFEEFIGNRAKFGEISRMDSHIYFLGMSRGETTDITVADGKTYMIKFIGIGEANDDGTRTMQFELNGVRRDVRVEDKSIQTDSSAVRYAETDNRNHVGSSIPGGVSKVFVKVGDKVGVGQPLFVIEAMKMETSVNAIYGGTVEEVCVKEGQLVKSGELLLVLS